MSLTNPTDVITEERLKLFYDTILPYLGGAASAGFTPIGTIIAVMGNAAPANYLACNGQVVNIADYPELANYFEQQFGSKNYFGGDGTTTFGICDLRGEFLRGTGTNGHTNNGDGANVGIHQDATYMPLMYDATQTAGFNAFYITSVPSINGDGNNRELITNLDKYRSARTYGDSYRTRTKITGTFDPESGDASSIDYSSLYSVRPTNTSVLFCIATKNIYLNPSLDYSTDEKVVSTWIDGKTIYQRTISITTPSTQAQTSIDLQLSDIGTFYNICSDGSFIIADASGLGVRVPLSCCWSHAQQSGVPDVYGIGSILVMRNGSLNIDLCTPHYWQNKSAYVTIQYTKTT